MKYYIILILLLFAGTTGAQEIVKMGAVKANNYGVAYSLPKTAIVVTAHYTKTTRKAGPFYQYAMQYLNTKTPIVSDEVIYSLDRIEADITGIPDKDKTYLVEFRPNSVAPFVSLTKDGLICAINAEYEFPKDNSPVPATVDNPKAPADPSTYFTEEILRAGSSVKQAELIAKRIYQIRESRANILSGDADNMPPDGDAYKRVMKRLDEEEAALTAMFAGTETSETGKTGFTIIPDEKSITDKVVFRFSRKLGVVAADNLGGAPVYLTLKNNEPRREVFLTPKEQKDMEKKFSTGIIYNIPGKASLKIVYNNKAYINTECEVVQYGQQEVLVPKMFENMKQPVKVIFYPDKGKIKEIMQ